MLDLYSVPDYRKMIRITLAVVVLVSVVSAVPTQHEVVGGPPVVKVNHFYKVAIFEHARQSDFLPRTVRFVMRI